MFAQSMTESEINAHGSSSDLRYFSTSYGATFGYNERARAYHRSYGLVTPPTNSAFSDYQLGDLATAPLYRRDHMGFRVEYADARYTWSESAAKLSKNQKHYGGEDRAASDADASASQQLPPRRVQFHATEFNVTGQQSPPQPREQDGPESQPRDESERDYQRRQQAEFEFAFEARRAHSQQQRELQQRQQQPAAASSAQSAEPRAILTSSLSPSRGSSLSATGRNPLLQSADHQNQQLYPTPGLKVNQANPQFDLRR